MDEKEQLLEKRVWKKEYMPVRQITLWGYDKMKNPGFLILYGIHEEDTTIPNNTDKIYLREQVIYESYFILTGKNGHLPSLPEEKVRETDSRISFPVSITSATISGSNLRMLLNSEWKRNRSWYYDDDETTAAELAEKELIAMEIEKRPVLSYYEEISYEECVNLILKYKNEFDGFQIVKNPEEILQFGETYAPYFQSICELFSYPNRYIRKKRLKELIQLSLPLDFYKHLIQIGSTELLSGLFLEFAKQKNPLLLEETEQLLQNIDFDNPGYIAGLKRCISIYKISMNEKEKAKQERIIRENLPNMDLHLLHIEEKECPADTIIEGAVYRKYASQGLLKPYKYDYEYNYERHDWKRTKTKYPIHYKKSIYSDGYYLNILEVKHTIQQAEIYDLPDVIGTIAYYMDAPRLTYYFRGNEKTKIYHYFKRCLRRIIDNYAKKDADKFMLIMKVLFSQYKKEDYICKFKENFQFNEFLRYYLYYEYKEEFNYYNFNYIEYSNLRGEQQQQYWNEWMEQDRIRRERIKSDELLSLQGRYEFHKEIWDTHRTETAEILLNTEIEVIQKACYFILNDATLEQLKEQLSSDIIVRLSMCSYTPVKQLFKTVLEEKLKDSSNIDASLLLAMIKSEDYILCKLAREYIEERTISLKADFYVELLLSDSAKDWISAWEEQLNQSSLNYYFDFVMALINKKEEIVSRVLPDFIKDELHRSTNWFASKNYEEKEQYWNLLLELLFYHSSYPEVIAEFLEELLFSFSNENFLVLPLQLEEDKWIQTERNNRIYSMLQFIKKQQIPNDYHIVGILEKGSQKMLQSFFQLVSSHKERLLQHKSALLLFAESNVTRLNELVKEILESLPAEQAGEYYSILLDSPIERAYQMGLYYLKTVYQSQIPAQWLLPLMEHTAKEVKEFITTYLYNFITQIGNGNTTLFIYYSKTILYLPNKLAKAKWQLYQVLPVFIQKYPECWKEIESILLDIGGSNVKTDSEKALITIAKIRNEVLSIEG